MNWSFLKKTLSGLSLRTYLLAFFVLYGVGIAAVVGRYGWNPTALIRIGHYYAEQNQRLTPPGAIEFLGNEHHGGNGYDGQIFYYYARTLWERNTWPRGFNNAYRAPRVGYPLLASALALPGIWSGNDALASWGTAIGLILVQLCLIPLGMLAFYRLLPADARYLTAFFLAAPFTLQSALLLVSDGVMIALQMIGLYFFVGGRAAVADGRALSALCRRPLDLTAAGLAGIAFSLAVLTKESSLFLLFPLGLTALLQRDFKRAALMVLVLLPMVAW